jgi:hypothetical protein
MVYQWCEFKSSEGKTKNLTAQQSNSSTSLIFRRIYMNFFLNIEFFIYIYIYREREGMDVVEWSRALDVSLNEWCCSISMVWVQIPSREEKKFSHGK